MPPKPRDRGKDRSKSRDKGLRHLERAIDATEKASEQLGELTLSEIQNPETAALAFEVIAQFNEAAEKMQKLADALGVDAEKPEEEPEEPEEPEVPVVG